MRKHHDNSSSRPGHVPQVAFQNNARMAAATSPTVKPFSEKARPGSHGNSRGVRTAPAVSAVKTATAARSPWWSALVQNLAGPPIPPRKKKSRAMTIAHFNALTSSTGISTTLSQVSNVFSRISGVALSPLSRKAGRSFDRIGPKTTLKPENFGTLCDATPGPDSCGRISLL